MTQENKQQSSAQIDEQGRLLLPPWAQAFLSSAASEAEGEPVIIVPYFSAEIRLYSQANWNDFEEKLANGAEEERAIAGLVDMLMASIDEEYLEEDGSLHIPADILLDCKMEAGESVTITAEETFLRIRKLKKEEEGGE